MMNLRNGTLLQGGKYRIEGVLGQGGFGITYLATHTALESRVAIKEYFDNKVNSRGSDGKSVTVSLEANRATFDAQRSKFRKEAQRMQKLDCEHIAKVYDFFDENGTSYYVMEYIDGGSLEQQLRQRGKFSEEEARDVLVQMLDALRVIHSRNMWHLDIKPGNIMCGSSGRLKLIDFGASKLMDPGTPTTTSSAIAYTPGFAPLEQIAGNMSAFGPWTDFYSLGATLYVLLTGNHPPIVDQIQAEGKSAFLWPASMRDTDLRRMVEWMMSPSRHDRPQSVAELMMPRNTTDVYIDPLPKSKRRQAEEYFDQHTVELLQHRGFFEQKKSVTQKIVWVSFFTGFLLVGIVVMWCLRYEDLIIACIGVLFCATLAGSVASGIGLMVVGISDKSIDRRLQTRIRENFIDEYIKTH